MHGVDGERARRRTHLTSQDTERSLVNIHDGVVFPFITVHLLKNMNKDKMYNKMSTLREAVNPSHRC